MENEIGLH